MSTQRDPLLIILHTAEYLRNYLTSHAFASLEEKYDCHYAIPDDLKDHPFLAPLAPGRLSYFAMDEAQVRRNLDHFAVMTWRHRRRSSSFRFRTIRHLRVDLLRWHGTPLRSLRHWASWLSWFGRDRKMKKALLFGTSRRLFSLYDRARRLRPVSPSLDAIVVKIAPRLIVFPSSAYDAIVVDLFDIRRRRGIETLFLIDNWDNLSSKIVFDEKPSYLGVWGEQSREHAARLHGVERDRVYLVGTPRFDSYFPARTNRPPSHFAFPYALFVGCSIRFDELSALRALDAEIAANPHVYGGLKVVYRPHPWRTKRLRADDLPPGALDHVVIDPQVEQNYRRSSASGKVSVAFQPSLDYYPSLLANAELVVGPLTSMIIESAIFRKPNVVIVYDDGQHFTSPARVYAEYEHFHGIDKVAGFQLVPHFDVLATTFRQTFLTRADVDADAVDRSLQHFLFSDSTPYPDRLVGVVDGILHRGVIGAKQSA